MSTWEQLDAFLESLQRKLGGSAFYLTDATKVQFSPYRRLSGDVLSSLEAAFAEIERRHGADFLRGGKASRTFATAGEGRFVGEPLLGAYLLLVFVPGGDAEDAWLGRVLDRERKTLIDIITGLPPIGGGRRAESVALAKDPA